jgi:hypothetical protein
MQVTYRGCLVLCACVCLRMPAEAWLMAPLNGSHATTPAFMPARRGSGSDRIYFNHAGRCTDSARHWVAPRTQGARVFRADPEVERALAQARVDALAVPTMAEGET